MLPQAVTIVLHLVGGYLVADVSDRLGAAQAGVAVATVIGVAKEATDLHFSFPDAIAWPVGAALYTLGKEKGWRWQGSEPTPWYYPGVRE